MSGPVLLSDLADEENADGLNVRPDADDGWATPPPVTLDDGTQVYLYKDGEGLRAGYEAIRAAKQRICLEMYIFNDDATGRMFADALCERARAGVAVYLIYDSFGSLDGRPLIERMRAAGVRCAEFHPLAPWRARFGWRPWNRDHRKLLVIDDDIAGLGGLNIGDEYAGTWVAGDRADLKHLMRDQAIGIVGPGAAVLLHAFAATWRYVHRGGQIRRALYTYRITVGPLGKGRRLGKGKRHGERRSPHSPADARVVADDFAILASAPTLASPLRPVLNDLLRNAARSITIIMAYFAPDDELIANLCEAAGRGVCVRLILPARSDLGVMVVAAHSFYAKLFDFGVEIYERQNAVLHAKTLLIDDRLVVIGSTNLDYRSTEINLELSALITNETFAGHVRDMLDHDVRFSKRIKADEWRRRPMFDRFVQWFVSRTRYLL